MATATSRPSTAEQPGPERAWIVTTSKCNLNCVHCARSIPEYRAIAESTPDMERAVFDRFCGQVLPTLRTVQFGGTNLGEPMMSRGLEDEIDRLRQSEGLREVKLQTNGTYLLNEQRLERLVRQNVRVMVSLEGVTEESYKRVRGVSFAHLRKALLAFKAVRARHPDSRADLLLAFTVCYDTLGELIALVEFAAEVGASQVTVNHFVPGRESHRYQSLVYHRGESNRALAEAKRRAGELGVAFVGPAPFPLPILRDDVEPAAAGSPGDPPCYHPWRSVSVNENGDVMPCCATNTVMGNLRASDFRTIWNGRRFRELRERVNSSRPPAYCRGCVLRGVDLDAASATLNADEAYLLNPIGSRRVRPDDIRDDLRRRLMRLVRVRVHSTPIVRRAALALRRLYWRHG